jgi:hypothetical protein
MFDVTKEDVAGLDDRTLRKLVGQLCEAEVHRAGLPVTCVRYGGHQNAGDGGLDVRVELPSGIAAAGCIPRTITGYQVKAQNMPASRIIREMAPRGVLRPEIIRLAEVGGAYILVSSKGGGSPEDKLQALRDATSELHGNGGLLVDFYDQQLMATLIRQFPGLVAWVRSKAGRPLKGWQPYDSWSQPGREAAAEFLLDEVPRVEVPKADDQPLRLTTAQGIHRVRNALAQPGRAVRLVGLSGVGKTRFVEALFDDRIGEQVLSTALVAYTNHEEHPDPTPEVLARTLVDERRRAILVVDNCGPELHRRLVDLCTSSGSTVSVLTIEFDVQDDEPERTDVLLMRGLPSPLVENLIRQRFPEVSHVNARTIAELADGNSRIALALAEASLQGRSISTLKANELFGRLFWQRGVEQPGLQNAAKVCSLVYSFDGDTLEGEDTELSHLAALAGQTAEELYRHSAVLERKRLVQRRGRWRAVLPHALANRLAGEALKELPTARIMERLESQPGGRLFKSFTHRLSFLVFNQKAKEIVAGWLEPEGRFGDVCSLNCEQWEMLRNIAPVAPNEALAAMERAGGVALTMVWYVARGSLDLLRSIAYEPDAFERACRLLIEMAAHAPDEGVQRDAKTTMEYLFQIVGSGTKAPVGMRSSVVERLLQSSSDSEQQLGLALLLKILQAANLYPHHSPSFGGRARDDGYRPTTWEEHDQWYCMGLALVERLAQSELALRPALCSAQAGRFHELWVHTRIQDPLFDLMRSLAGGRFWRAGWAACRKTLHYSGKTLRPGLLTKLRELEQSLRPTCLADQVRAMALGRWDVGLDLDGVDDFEMDAEERSARRERQEKVTCRLGIALAGDPAVMSELMPDLMLGGMRIRALGQGLATGATDIECMWAVLAEGYCAAPAAGRDARILCGFLDQLARHDRAVAHKLVVDAQSNPHLNSCLTQLHAAIGLDATGVDRLVHVAKSGTLPAGAFRDLDLWQATNSVDENSLRRLLLAVAELPDGVDAALHMLYMKLYSDQQAGHDFGPVLKSCGLELLIRGDFAGRRHSDFYSVEEVASACLAGEGGQEGAVQLALHLRRTSSGLQMYSGDYDGLLATLFRLHPVAVLEALFSGSAKEIRAAQWMLDPVRDHHANPLADLSIVNLLAWCAGDPVRRFPIAASLVPYAQREEPDGPRGWTEAALALIRQAPDPEAVLLEIVHQFRPRGWSGSGAAIIESNGELLDLLPDLLPTTLATAIEGAKAACQRSIDSMRRMEDEMDRHRPEERFE